MKPRSFAALAVVTAIALVVAIATYFANNRWSQPKVTGAALFPGLAAQASRIARIELKQADKSLTLVRDKEAWSLADRGGYPAKADSVRSLLVKLSGAELVEPKTRNKDRYALLEVEDPNGKDSKSREVRLLDDKGGVIAQTIVGKKRFDALGGSKSATYVRKPGDVQSWLSSADLDISPSPRDWVPANVLDVPQPKIAKLTLEMPGEDPLVIERDAADKAKYTLAGMPADKKLKEGAGLDGIVRAAGNIELDDVRKPSGAAPPPADLSVVKVEADGGLSVTLKLRKEGEDTWVSIEATGTEDEARKTAEDITKRTQGWEYKIAPYKAQSILKRRADLFAAS